MSEQAGEEQYLDYSAFMRKLEKAEQGHNLDRDGVVEQLTGAVLVCHGAGGRHQAMSDEYMIAKAHYLAEIRRRVGISRYAAKNGRNAGLGLKGWARANGLDYYHVFKMARIAEHPNPALALQKHREKNQISQKAHRAMLKEAKNAMGLRKTDSLNTIKREWYKLSRVQRSAFLDWAIDQAPMSDYAEAA